MAEADYEQNKKNRIENVTENVETCFILQAHLLIIVKCEIFLKQVGKIQSKNKTTNYTHNRHNDRKFSIHERFSLHRS